MNKRLEIGEKVGDYQITGFLGAGGMGAVYLGVHTKINRAAAIKLLTLPGGNDSTYAQRFFNEARLQSSLPHPNIATLYDFQETGSRLFIVMEYVDGETLEALIKRQFFAVEEALKTFETICEAIAFIHDNNIIHRDIKPQNIKLSSTGKVKLLDFGIAKGAESQTLTRAGGLIGTPNYLAPEQFLGCPATPQTDIWSLGVLFYEMLTGREPFPGKTLSELHMQITSGRYEEPENLNPAIPAEVSRIIAGCLKKSSGERYQTVKELLADIRRALRKYDSLPVVENKRNSYDFLLKRKAKTPVIRLSTASDSDRNSSADHEMSAIPEKRSLKLIAGVVTAAVLLAIGIFGIWVMANSNDSPQENAQGLENSVVTNDNRTVKPRLAQLSSANQLPRVRVEVLGTSAQVYRNGQLLGATPLELEGSENESADLVLKCDGYEDQKERIEITTRKKVYTFLLRRKQ